MMNVILMGAPGCGKSSVATRFCEFRHYEHISSGAIARDLALIDEHTREALEQGAYAPESAMRVEVASRIEQAMIRGEGIVLDGFPRTIAQLIFLEKIVMRTIYIHLDCSPYECIQRIIERGREHDESDAVASRFESYHRDTLPWIDRLGPYASNFYRIINHTQTLEETVSSLATVVEEHERRQ